MIARPRGGFRAQTITTALRHKGGGERKVSYTPPFVPHPPTRLLESPREAHPPPQCAVSPRNEPAPPHAQLQRGVNLVPRPRDRLHPVPLARPRRQRVRSNERPATSLDRLAQARATSPRRHQSARPTRPRSPARPDVGGDHRQPARQRLEQHDRQVLELAREHEHVRGRASAPRPLGRQRAEEPHVRPAASLELLAQLAVADDLQDRVQPATASIRSAWRFFSASAATLSSRNGPSDAAAPGGRSRCRRRSARRGSARAARPPRVARAGPR